MPLPYFIILLYSTALDHSDTFSILPLHYINRSYHTALLYYTYHNARLYYSMALPFAITFTHSSILSHSLLTKPLQCYNIPPCYHSITLPHSNPHQYPPFYYNQLHYYSTQPIYILPLCHITTIIQLYFITLVCMTLLLYNGAAVHSQQPHNVD